jgi:hemolysin activation/secretion protein
MKAQLNYRDDKLQPLVLVFALVTLFSGKAWCADSVSEPRLAPLDRPSFLKEKDGDAFRLPPVPTAPLPSQVEISGHVITVRKIAFRGNLSIPSTDLEDVAASYVGRPINEADIEELRQKLTRFYIARGYVSSGALLRNNAFIDTTLTYDIVEGKLDDIRVQGLERLQESYVIDRLNVNTATALNIDKLRDRFTLLLGDPLFERMNARLIPGTRQGAAILDIDVVRALPYQLNIYSNNYRPPSIGADSLGLSGWVRNLTGYGDVLEVDLQCALQHTESQRTDLVWRMPINAHGTHVSLELYHGLSSVLEEPMRALKIESILDTQDIGLSQILHETLNHKLSLGLNYVARKNRSKLMDEPFSFVPGEPEGVTEAKTWRFWQEYAYRSENQVFALRSTFSATRNNLEDISWLPPNNIIQPDHRYLFWLGQAQYAHQIASNGAQIILRGNIQHTSDRLLALDRLSVGGVNTVRGYLENQLIRDQGGSMSIELDYPIYQGSATGLSASLIPFYDFGKGWNKNEPADRLRSFGLATRVRWQGFKLDFAVAKRLEDTNTLYTGTLQDKGIHLQLGYNFF